MTFESFEVINQVIERVYCALFYEQMKTRLHLKNVYCVLVK
jgi:hypothetical protein